VNVDPLCGGGVDVFEFHGWATIRVPEIEESDVKPIGRGPEVEAIKRVRAAINDVHDEFSLFDVKQTGNGQTVLIAHGLRNHKFAPVIELFRWVATELPASYGLLYVHDDEATGQDNEFRVWRLALGKFEKVDDPFLSPYIPTVERPIEG
jgi:hypothetical protein